MMKMSIVLLLIACFTVASALPPPGAQEPDRKIENKEHAANDKNRDLRRFLRMFLRKDVLCTEEGEHCRDDCCKGYECRQAEGIMPIWKCVKCTYQRGDCNDDDECCDGFECKETRGSKKCLK